eukprot:gnl/TRDRNA2_/TRDRNA2_196236_c0_seq1.p1 gnl/TRDRNA2_/TRDRNA2_196236_c0~~gnl/TRDRNA2_/TRDRNA2_196236_c0_seq1.p1  ORF type:complete len:264 (+),score=83.03 gnl/TRDRNA2_/TRDRNA2_196236_c0_seq1:45-836(+)
MTPLWAVCVCWLFLVLSSAADDEAANDKAADGTEEEENPFEVRARRIRLKEQAKKFDKLWDKWTLTKQHEKFADSPSSEILISITNCLFCNLNVKTVQALPASWPLEKVQEKLFDRCANLSYALDRFDTPMPKMEAENIYRNFVNKNTITIMARRKNDAAAAKAAEPNAKKKKKKEKKKAKPKDEDDIYEDDEEEDDEAGMMKPLAELCPTVFCPKKDPIPGWSDRLQVMVEQFDDMAALGPKPKGGASEAGGKKKKKNFVEL